MDWKATGKKLIAESDRILELVKADALDSINQESQVGLAMRLSSVSMLLHSLGVALLAGAGADYDDDDDDDDDDGDDDIFDRPLTAKEACEWAKDMADMSERFKRNAVFIRMLRIAGYTVTAKMPGGDSGDHVMAPQPVKTGARYTWPSYVVPIR